MSAGAFNIEGSVSGQRAGVEKLSNYGLTSFATETAALMGLSLMAGTVLANTRPALVALNPSGSLYVTVEELRQTYSFGSISLAPAATPTDIITLGGSSLLTKVTKFSISCLSTTAGTMNLAFIKRTAANSGGTVVAKTPTKFRTADINAAAVLNEYTANAAGLGAGTNIETAKLDFRLTGNLAPPIVFEWGRRARAPLLAASSTEFFCVNLNGDALPAGGVINYGIEWTEE